VAQGASILARFRNTSNFDRLIGVGLQAAVPKSQKLTLQAINRSKLEGGEEATQAMRVVGATGVSLSFIPR
jgi:AP-1 complex subunit gamma-1